MVTCHLLKKLRAKILEEGQGVQLHELLAGGDVNAGIKQGERRLTLRSDLPISSTSPGCVQKLSCTPAMNVTAFDHMPNNLSASHCLTHAHLQARARSRTPANVSPRAAQSLAVMSRCVESIEWMKFGANAVLCLRLFTGR